MVESGMHKGLKIPRSTRPCGFDSRSEHHNKKVGDAWNKRIMKLGMVFYFVDKMKNNVTVRKGENDEKSCNGGFGFGNGADP